MTWRILEMVGLERVQAAPFVAAAAAADLESAS